MKILWWTWGRHFQALPPRIRMGLLALSAMASVYMLWFVVDVFASIPNRNEIRAFSVMPRASVLFDGSDRPVFTLAKEHRIEIPLTQVSPNLIRAVVAIEDRRFFDHEGYDLRRILASALAVLRAGRAVQGGSTITQQLARQSLGREKTLRRKLKELLTAIELERHYSKREILELYLNKVYFGDGLYGVEAASRGYFAKHAAHLTIAEAALLAGLLQAPSAYAPTVSVDKARARRDVVLRSMVETKGISPAEYDGAVRTPIRLRDGLRSHEPHGAYFKEEVRRQLVQQFGWERVSEGGLQVFTTFDADAQRAAESAVVQGLFAIDRTLPRSRGARLGAASDTLQAALVAVDPQTGALRAMVGGRDFAQSPYNRATQARRQPGSAFKPFVYAAALEAGYRPDDVIDRLDEPLQLTRAAWSPDDEHVSETSLTLRDALRLSSNRAAVRLLDRVGLPRTLSTARAFGFDNLPNVPSVALGSGEVTVDAMTAAFAAFANGGVVARPFVIRRVLDRDGIVLFELNEEARRAMRPENAYRMADMLADVIDFGTGSAARRLGFDLPAGGKTGTTNEYRDAWFVGFTPTLVAGVWVGYDQPRTIRPNGYASDLAVPIWAQFMKDATRGDPPRWLAVPGGLTDEQLRGNIRAAGGARTPEKRGFWARLFGIGEDRRSRQDRRERVVIVRDDERGARRRGDGDDDDERKDGKRGGRRDKDDDDDDRDEKRRDREGKRGKR